MAGPEEFTAEVCGHLRNVPPDPNANKTTSTGWVYGFNNLAPPDENWVLEPGGGVSGASTGNSQGGNSSGNGGGGSGGLPTLKLATKVPSPGPGPLSDNGAPPVPGGSQHNSENISPGEAPPDEAAPPQREPPPPPLPASAAPAAADDKADDKGGPQAGPSSSPATLQIAKCVRPVIRDAVNICIYRVSNRDAFDAFQNGSIDTALALFGLTNAIGALGHFSGKELTTANIITGGLTLFGTGLQKAEPPSVVAQISSIESAALQYLMLDDVLAAPTLKRAPSEYIYVNSYAHLFDAAMTGCSVGSQ